MSNIDVHNDSFKTIIEGLQGRIVVLEGAKSGENHLVYPQKWATGDGTAENPWANDCIQKAYDACPTGGTIFLKAGYYELNDELIITKSINIIGEGTGRTIVVTANAHGFYLREVDYVTVKDFTVDGDSQTDGTKYLSCVDVEICNYILLENLEVKNAGYYGVHPYGVNNSVYLNIYAHDNYSDGVHPTCGIIGRNKWNVYRDIYAYNNGSVGFDEAGNYVANEKTYNVYDNLQCWNNASHGIAIFEQKNCIISNLSTSRNASIGIWLDGVEDSNIHDCIAVLNGKEGLRISGSSKNINVTDVITKNNDCAGIDNRSGITVRDSNDVKFTSCQSYDDRTPMLQKYGIRILGNVPSISLTNCKLIPILTDRIKNDAGAIIIEWPSTDTDLDKLTADFNALLVRIKAASEAVNE